MTDLDIVIVNWNSGRFLQECVDSVTHVASTDHLQCAIYVVDNGSTDSLALSGPFELVRNEQNEGFGAACNQGAVIGKSQYILFLNPDTRVLPGVLRAAYLCMNEGADNIGIVGVRMVDNEGHPQISCSHRPTTGRLIADALGLSKIWPRSGLVIRDLDHSKSGIVDQVIGAFFFMRRADFEALGGFDPQFFVYMDEADLAKRAADRGIRSFFLAEASCYHKGNGATDQVKGKRLAYNMMSRCQYAHKHFQLPSALLVTLAIALLEPFARFLQATISASPSAMLATLEGTIRFYEWSLEKIIRGGRARKPSWA